MEFLGIAGSGKTALCSALAAQLRRDGFTIITRDDYSDWMGKPWHEKAWAVITNGAQTWRFVLRLLNFLYFSARLPGRALIKTCYHLTYMQVWLSRTVSRATPFPILLDQFAWHRLANQLMHRPFTEASESQLAHAVALFYPRCDLHWVFKTAPVDVAVQRIAKRHVRHSRPPWFIEKLPSDRQKILLRRQLHLYQLVCDAIRLRYADNLYCVGTVEAIADEAHHIKNVISKSMRQDMDDTSIFDTSPIYAEP